MATLPAKWAAATNLVNTEIRNEVEYHAVVAEVERLFGSPVGTPSAERFALLASLVEAYEQEHYPINAPSEHAAKRYQQEKQGVGGS